MKVKIYVYLHTIFCTAEHRNIIGKPERMKQLLQEAFHFYNCELYEVSGTSNHVHLLHSANPEMCTDELLKKIKLASQTRYQREIDPDFFWEPGYYVFSISGEDLEAERINLLKQGNLHRKISLDSELKQYRDELQMELSENIADLDEHQYN
jgi:putative transposase